MCDSTKKTIEVLFKNPYYEEVLHVQSFTIESWIGNAGGYLGLFVGFAFWQIPELLDFLSTKISNILKMPQFT